MTIEKTELTKISIEIKRDIIELIKQNGYNTVNNLMGKDIVNNSPEPPTIH